MSTKFLTNTKNAYANTAPFNISSGDNLPISFTTPTISIIAKDILVIKLPSLLMFLPGIIPINDNNATKTKNAATNPAPCFNSVGFNIPISLTAATINNSVTAIFLSILPALSIF